MSERDKVASQLSAYTVAPLTDTPIRVRVRSTAAWELEQTQ